jgi:hypothetical protein
VTGRKYFSKVLISFPKSWKACGLPIITGLFAIHAGLNTKKLEYENRNSLSK